MKKTFYLYEIEWMDAITPGGSWRTLEGAFKWSEENKGCVVECGYLLKQDETHWVLASRIARDTFSEFATFGGLFKIPKPWIVRKKKLGKITVDVEDQK